MNKEKNNEFIIKNEEGEEITCKVIFTFDSEETGKSYIIYTDGTVGEDGKTLAYASSFDPNDETSSLLPVETEEEWDLIYSVYNSLEFKDEE